MSPIHQDSSKEGCLEECKSDVKNNVNNNAGEHYYMPLTKHVELKVTIKVKHDICSVGPIAVVENRSSDIPVLLLVYLINTDSFTESL